LGGEAPEAVPGVRDGAGCGVVELGEAVAVVVAVVDRAVVGLAAGAAGRTEPGERAAAEVVVSVRRDVTVAVSDLDHVAAEVALERLGVAVGVGPGRELIAQVVGGSDRLAARVGDRSEVAVRVASVVRLPAPGVDRLDEQVGIVVDGAGRAPERIGDRHDAPDGAADAWSKANQPPASR